MSIKIVEIYKWWSSNNNDDGDDYNNLKTIVGLGSNNINVAADNNDSHKRTNNTPQEMFSRCQFDTHNVLYNLILIQIRPNVRPRSRPRSRPSVKGHA